MPGLLDKVRLNCRLADAHEVVIAGNAAGVHIVYEAAESLAEEVEEKGWLDEPEVKEFLEQQEKLCASYHPAQEAYQRAQLHHKAKMTELAEDLRKWIEKRRTTP